MQVLQLNDASASTWLCCVASPGLLLFRDLLINVTSFFRDPEAFDFLGEHVVPEILADKGQACVRSGYRAAPRAGLFHRHPAQGGGRPLAAPQDFASSRRTSTSRRLSSPVPRATRRLFEGVSPERLERFFVADGENYVVAGLRDLCIFSAHSLIRDPPFSQIDLISSRNLLIYLGAELQNRVMPVFHYALRPGGYLFLGAAENITQHADLFVPVGKKCGSSSGATQHHPGIGAAILAGGQWPTVATATPRPKPEVPSMSQRQELEAHVLEHFAPAYVLIDQEGDIVHSSSKTGKYLEMPPGTPTRQLMSMARKGPGSSCAPPCARQGRHAARSCGRTWRSRSTTACRSST